MDFNYLREIKKLYENSSSLLEIIFILGNNTCDLDSALSSYLLSIGENIDCGTINLSKKGKPSMNENAKIVYIPVLNIQRGTLPYRIDVKYIFNKFNIDENDFWYISDPIFDPHNLFRYKNSENRNIKTSIILVDHTLLIDEEKYLADYVIDIYDHHLLTNYLGLYKNLKQMNIRYPVGSCSTLILHDFFCMKKEEDFPTKIISPILAVSAILIDTKKFKDEFYKNRWVDFDKKVYKYIKKIIKEEYKGIKMKEYFKEIKDIKHDIQKNLELGVEALLIKDQKTFHWDNRKAVWSSFPVSYYDIVKKYGNEELYSNIMKYYSGKSEEEQKNIYYITNSNINKKQKLFTIYNPIKLPFNKEEIIKEIKSFNQDENISAEIEKININENSKIYGEICCIILPDTFSRKSFEPILKKFFGNLNL